ncbi:hypothetical protein pb186bvf_010800 [Paramecium bursaria]
MSEERLEPRPETSKCSRFEKRRMASQNQQRTKLQVQHRTTQNFYQPNYNGITLEQYFRGMQKPVNKKKEKLLVTSNDFFNQEAQRKPHSIKEEICKIQQQEKELYEKYASKFDLSNEHFQVEFEKSQVDQMYGKLK